MKPAAPVAQSSRAATTGCGRSSARRRATIAASVVCAGLLFAGAPAAGAPICRWVDDSGRTHVADKVPERYAAKATCGESSQYEIDPDRLHRAQQQARELRQRADLGKPSGEPSSSAAAAATPAGPPASDAASLSSPGRRPAKGVDASTDCVTWRRLYRESGECFGPYRTVGGGVKAEAFEKCRPIPSPDLQCGPARN